MSRLTAVGSLIASGRTSDVHEYGRDAVIKIPRSTVPESWPRYEARNAAAVRALGAPVPEVIDVVRVDGRDAIVFERIVGPTMWELLVAGSARAPELGALLAEVHRRILEVGVPLGVAAMVERVAEKVQVARSLSSGDRATASQTVAELPSGAALLHGDLHPGNILMSERGPVVIDWFDAAVGHPVADIVRTSLLVRPLARPIHRPHVPDMATPTLADLHGAYVAAMETYLRPALVDLPSWEGIIAASRLAEEAEIDDSSLLDVWRNRRRPTESVLVTAMSLSPS